MSHFSVIVIGSNHEQQLAPYHEFECTGQNDQYVQDIDKTEEARKEYEESTSRVLVSPDGAHHDPYDDQFYRDPSEAEVAAAGPMGMMGTGFGGGVSHTSKDWGDGRGYRAKVRFIPEGWEETEVATKSKESFADWASGYYGSPVVKIGTPIDREEEHKFGYILVDEKGEVISVIDRTNPNKKWDWWQIGGRFGGLLLKDGTTSPQTTFGEIDFAAIRSVAEEKAGSEYDCAMSIIGDLPVNQKWEFVRDENDIEGSKEKYWQQPRCAAWRYEAHKHSCLSWDSSPDDYLSTRDEFVKAAGDSSFTPFAVLKDGKWHERGEMGWFACVSGEKDKETWADIVRELFRDLPSDTEITKIDCHI